MLCHREPGSRATVRRRCDSDLPLIPATSMKRTSSPSTSAIRPSIPARVPT